jgi:hypothetical protein
MNYRINTRVIAVVGALAIIATGLFLYTVVSSPAPEEVVIDSQEQEAVDADMLITARHQFKDGVHTIAGTVSVPTACHRVQAVPFLLNEGSVVEIRFVTLMEGVECPSRETDVQVRVPFEAVENAEIRATWNGALVRLNLINVGPDEPLDGDVYIKG